MKKQDARKLQLNKDTLRHLDGATLDKVLAGEPTTTVQTHWRTCTCQV
ncbi:MAG: class I lanthipeptide [Acidobacteria bacterium]|nr:class I lanthipeptide [Acidobacteriota bacterium]